MAVEKSYLYKVFRGGNFLGVIDPATITSPFKYTLNIESAGAALDIDIAADPYTAQNTPDQLITESGDDLITEDGDLLVTESQTPLFGNDSEDILIRNGNDVQVWEISAENPSGVKVFEGYISRWKVNFGGTNIISATVLSYGVELDNYVISSGESADVSQTSHDSSDIVISNGGVGLVRSAVQSWTPAATNFSALDLQVKERGVGGYGAEMLVEVFSSQAQAESSSPTGLLGSASRVISGLAYATYHFTFSTPITTTPGTVYWLRITQSNVTTSNALALLSGSTGPYAGGIGRQSDFSGVWSTIGDYYFITYGSTGSTTSAYSSQDPSNILRSILDDYRNQGGTIVYTAGSISDTGLSRSYTFKVNTTLEGIKKVLELSAYNWYWRVDPASSTLYFKQTSSTADHTMVLGQHISSLDLEASIERVKNVVYFSGGDIGGGVNLYLKGTASSSLLATQKRGLERISDNRVTLTATAQAIIDNFLNGNSAEGYITSLVIPSSVYDISLFDVGETIGFAGFGNMIDRLILQIVSVTREADQITLGLGMLPITGTDIILETQDDVQDIQTIDNPDTPS